MLLHPGWGSGCALLLWMENQPLWCCFEGFVLRLCPLVASVPGSPAGGRDGASLPLDHVVRCSSARGRVLTSWGPLWVPGSFDSPATGTLSLLLDSFEVVLEWVSSSHGWPLLHWRHLSVFRPASASDHYLSGLRAGDCGLPRRRRVHSRVLMVACLPLLWVWRTAPSLIPLMLVHRPVFICGLSWPLLDFPLCGFSAGLCRSSLASPSRCLLESARALRRLISPHCGLFGC